MDEAETERLVTRPRSVGLISCESFEGERSEAIGMLMSFWLRSLKILLLSCVAEGIFLLPLPKRGILLPLDRNLEGVVPFLVALPADSPGGGDASDPGWETQSSERESSHAWSMATVYVKIADH